MDFYSHVFDFSRLVFASWDLPQAYYLAYSSLCILVFFDSNLFCHVALYIGVERISFCAIFFVGIWLLMFGSIFLSLKAVVYDRMTAVMYGILSPIRCAHGGYILCVTKRHLSPFVRFSAVLIEVVWKSLCLERDCI